MSQQPHHPHGQGNLPPTNAPNYPTNPPGHVGYSSHAGQQAEQQGGYGSQPGQGGHNQYGGQAYGSQAGYGSQPPYGSQSRDPYGSFGADYGSNGYASPASQPNQPGPHPSQQAPHEAWTTSAPQQPQAWGTPGTGQNQPAPYPTHTPNHAPGQPGPHQGWAASGYSDGQLYQRTYDEGRFAPSHTQALRLQNRVQHHQGGPVHAPWTTQAVQVAPRSEQKPGDTGDLVRLIVALVLGGLLLLGFAIIFLFFMLQTGAVALIAMVLSSFPLFLIIGMVLWFDRWKPQPKSVMAVCVLWGGVAAVILTLVLQFPLKIMMAQAGVTDESGAIGAVVLAPIFEETTKGFIMVVIVLAARRYFEGPLDGWVYGSLAGAGFAFTENILYLSSAYVEGAQAGVAGGSIALAFTFILRCLLSPLLHSTFTMCAGVSIGLAARRSQWWAAVIMWIPGLILGMILHATWNGLNTFLRADSFIVMLILVIVPSLIVSALWFGTGFFLQFNESKQTRANLGDYANAGWLTHEEVDMLGTWKGRRMGKRWARQFPGGLGFMKSMIRVAANLANTRMRVVAGVGGTVEQQRERYLLDEFTKERAGLMRVAGQQGGF